MDSVYLLSEPGAEEAVDDEVGGGVDDEEDVGDEAEEDYPDGKTSKDSATTDLDLLQEFFSYASSFTLYPCERVSYSFGLA